MTRPLLALLAATLVARAAPAVAQPAQLVNAIAGDGPGLDRLVLVGESGQLYQPGDEGWRRDGAGGVAGDVAGALRGANGTIFVGGGRAPVYELVDGAWRVRSLGVRQRSRASTLNGFPIVAVGRQLYTLDGEKWRRIGAAPTTRIDVVWAASEKHIYLIEDDGDLRRRDGRSWATISHGFTAPELPARLIGISDKAVFAIGDAGTIARLGTRASSSIALPDELQGFRSTAEGSDGKARVYLAGTLPTADGGARQVLVSLDDKGTASLVDELPALDEGDRYSLIVARPTGALLVASYRGKVRLRAADGSWSERAVTNALPVEPPVAERDARKPARTH